MKKDIYIIRNRLNEKVYIGQTVNAQQRWAQYKSAVKKKPNEQLITKAMNKYGFNNFWMEIIEKDVEKYDEREQYWIKYYNSIAPYGYNLAPGDKGNGNGIFSSGASIKDYKTLQSIREDLIATDIPFKQLAQKYNVSYLVINEISLGHTYYDPDLKYPLRDSKKYSKEKLKQITYALKYELDKSLRDIAKEYNCDYSFLNDINLGRSYYRDYLDYPLRLGKMKRQQEYLPLVLNDLMNTNISQTELAKKYKISKQTISNINTGKAGRQDNITYPIRTEASKGRSCFSPAEINLIYDDLKNLNLSINQIATKWNVSATCIQNINNGKTKKYYNNNIKYPIRKKITPVSTIHV